MQIEREEKLDDKYSLWLCNIKGVGNRTILKLIDYFGDAGEIYSAPTKEVKYFLGDKQMQAFVDAKKNFDVDNEYYKLKQSGMNFVTMFSDSYPKRLKNIADKPYALFYYGSLPEEHKMSVAVIGARDCSDYGRYVANGIGEILGKNRISVISGMARGIDGISQRAALFNGGKSYGVLGCGADICYPKENRELYELLKSAGGIISSYPPGTVPVSQNFPPRNRIVSGLCDVLIVVEARNKSGTIITVDMALEQGKEVCVVPGRITDRLSDGCNNLIKQGANIILSPYDFLNELLENYNKSTEDNKKDDAGCLGRKCITNSNMEMNNIEQSKLEQNNFEHGKFEQNNFKNNKLRKSEFNISKYMETDLNNEKRRILQALDINPRSVEEISTLLNNEFEIHILNGFLMELCIEEMVVQVSNGYFKLKI